MTVGGYSCCPKAAGRWMFTWWAWAGLVSEQLIGRQRFATKGVYGEFELRGALMPPSRLTHAPHTCTPTLVKPLGFEKTPPQP